jgi:hypothetical protein
MKSFLNGEDCNNAIFLHLGQSELNHYVKINYTKKITFLLSILQWKCNKLKRIRTGYFKRSPHKAGQALESLFDFFLGKKQPNQFTGAFNGGWDR